MASPAPVMKRGASLSRPASVEVVIVNTAAP